MRATTLISLVLAVVLAGLASYAARTWLMTERQQIIESTTQAASSDAAVDEKNTIVVAKTQLQFGTRLTLDNLDTIEWASDKLPPGAFGSVEALVSDDDDNARWVMATIAEGEPVFESKITDPGQRAKLSTALSPGMKAISIRVNDVLGVAGFVLPGDRVDVMLTRDTNEGTVVDVLLQGVKVLAIDQTADDRRDQATVVRTVTFEVSTEEAQKLALGANVGTLSLALRNVASAEVEQIRRVTVSDLGVPDVADELKAQAEQALAQASEEDADEISRNEAVEALLKGFMDEISSRLEGVETSIEQQSQVVIESQPSVEIEDAVERVQAVEPPTTTPVGVTREGRRQEYWVIMDSNANTAR